MQFKRRILPNGVRVLVIPMPSFESATVLVMSGAGSRYETSKNSGISHFLEHMAFKGTEKRPDAMSISSLVDGIGGEFNAFTGRETTGFYVKAAASQAELCLDLLSDMLQHSKFDPIEINKEKGVIMEEINLYEDMPHRKIGDIYEELLYGDTPMGWDIAGSKDVIRSITREDFVEYMKSLYSADNITLVIAGGVDPEAMFALAQKYLGNMPKFSTIKAIKVEDGQNSPAFKLVTKTTEQVHFAMGFRTVPLDDMDQNALEVLSAVLGGGMSSRLFLEIREKRGLAYYVRSSHDQYVDCGTFVSTAGVDPKRADEAIKVMIEQYKYVTSEKGKVTEEELKKAKEFIKGHLVLELEDSRSVSGFYAHQELLDKKVENPDESIAEIEAVTLEQVNFVAKKYFTKNTLNLAVIGNFTDRQPFEKLLELY